MNYDPSWKDDIPKKKFRILELVGNAFVEVVFSYPVFQSLEEGLEYINIVLDPYQTGHYGISVES